MILIIKITVLIISLINSFSFLVSKHPISLTLILLIQTTLITIICGINFKNFWFSYILFLIFLGGILIIFIYIVSLASNENFKNFKFNNFLKIIIFSSLFIITIILRDNFFFVEKIINLEDNEITNSIRLNVESSLILNKIYNLPNRIITVLLIIYLLFCLIAVCKIVNIFEGPLRPKF